MINVGERIHVVRVKMTNIEAFGAATTTDTSSLRSLEFSSSVSGSKDCERDEQPESMSQSGTY